jgi:PAS domain S-box-containing protein
MLNEKTPFKRPQKFKALIFTCTVLLFLLQSSFIIAQQTRNKESNNKICYLLSSESRQTSKLLFQGSQDFRLKETLIIFKEFQFIQNFTGIYDRLSSASQAQSLYKEPRWIYLTLAIIIILAVGGFLYRIILKKEKTIKSLKESEQKYRNFFHTSKDCVFITTWEGTWLELNDAAADLFGYNDKEEIKQINVRDFYFDPNERKEHLNTIIDQGYTKGYPVKLKRKDGSVIHTLISSVPLKNSNNETVGFQGTIKDISDIKATEKALRSEKNKLQQITETNPISITVLNKMGKLTFANTRAQQVLGLSNDQIKKRYFNDVSWKIRDFEGNPVAKENLPFKRVMKTGKPVFGAEHTIEHEDGTKKYLLINAAPLLNENSKPEGVVASLLDITDRIQIEKHVQHLNTVLDAVRSVNQLIIREKNKEKLIKKVCETLTEIRGFTSVWVALIDSQSTYATHIAASNIGQSFETLKMQMQEGNFPACIQKTLNGNKILIPDKHSTCTECVISKSYKIPDKIILRLEYAGKIFGVLNVSLPKEITEDQEEQALLEELADDISFALHNIELVEQHQKAEKELQKSEQTFRNLVENAFDAIYFMRGRHYEYVNKRFCEITGYTFEELTSPSFDFEALLTEHSRHTVEERYKARQKGEEVPNQYEIQLKSKDGRYKYVELTTVSMEPESNEKENEVLVMGIMRDTTQRREAERELIKAKRKAEESDQLKSNFLTNMSHEIRTPMNGIIGFSQLLASQKMDFEKQKEFLDIIQNRSNHLLKIIDDIIDISKIEANKLLIEKQYFNINSMLRNLQTTYELELDNKNEKQVKLHVDNSFKNQEAQMYSDNTRVEQILSNLLNNAIKFTSEGTITLGCKPYKDKSVLFYVKDTGVGIPEKQQKIIFERFRQADDSISRTYGGTGIGLSISKKLTELLGGKIWFNSEENKGTVFYAAIPYYIEKVTQTDNHNNECTSSEIDLSNEKILIVEDDVVSLQFIEEILRPTNAKLITAENGYKALDIFENNNDISLVLMDIRLPDISGFEITKKMKQSNPYVPVIAQTAYALKSDKKKSLEAGCDDHISKPINYRELWSIIENVLH